MLCHVASCVHLVHGDQIEIRSRTELHQHCVLLAVCYPFCFALSTHLHHLVVDAGTHRGIGVAVHEGDRICCNRASQIGCSVISPSAPAPRRGRNSIHTVLETRRALAVLDPDAIQSWCRQHCSGMHRRRAEG